MLRIVAVFLVSFSLVGCAIHKPCKIPPPVLSRVQELRELEFKQIPRCRYEKPAETYVHLKEALFKQNSPERLRYEGDVYRILGIVPWDYDYLQSILKSLTERSAGYYDSETKTFAVVVPAQVDRSMIVMHELTHALQDQHFDLDALFTKELTNDQLLARMAVAEGDADRVMHLFAENLDCEQVGRELFSELKANIEETRNVPTPQSIRIMMAFPYVFGLDYACRNADPSDLSRLNGKFRTPPRSTSEVIHPDRSFDDNAHEQVTMRLSTETQGRIVFSDVIGELAIFALLSSDLEFYEAQVVASGWRADGLNYFEGSSGKGLIWITRWADDAAAEKFFRAVNKSYQKRLLLAPAVQKGTLVFENEQLQIRIEKENQFVFLRALVKESGS